MISVSQHESLYDELVALRYSLYSGLFSTLPYGNLKKIENQLANFSHDAEEILARGESPINLVDRFLVTLPESERWETLFRFLQIVEREIVLFDAVEDAAFPALHKSSDSGTLKTLIQRVREEGVQDQYIEKLRDYSVRIVLTAHPTQFYPDQVLGIIRELTPALRGDDLDTIRMLMIQLGRTRFRNREKPTPIMEALSVLWYLQNNFYSVVPTIWEQAVEAFPSDLAPESLTSLLEIGFWPGGDRDGNPFVTADVTLAVAAALKRSILTCYLRDAKALKKRLTFDGVYELLIGMISRIEQTLAVVNGSVVQNAYGSAQELEQDIQAILDALYRDHQGLFADQVEQLQLRIRLFGFHFAVMDLRQDSRVHHAVCTELMVHLGKTRMITTAELEQWNRGESPVELITAILGRDIPAKIFDSADLSEIARDTLESYDAVRSVQGSNGMRAIHRSIISNTQSAANLFEVLLLIHLSGGSIENAHLDIVPLFETIEDLKNADAIMAELYANPFYRAHLERQGTVQHIMVGFSDGTKDGGYLGANLGIYQAKRRLTALSRDAGIRAVFFDGRGGPPARGGGNTHRFYRSLGKEISHDQIHLTIQGQTISSNFGTLESARYNIEQIFTAGLESSLFHHNDGVLGSSDGELLETLAKIAREKYKLLRDDPLFVPYLEEMTPLRFYDRLNVGSRPVKRKGTLRSFSDLRAIPFVGSWSQIKQNVPGFYGLGTALQWAKNQPELWSEIRKLYRENLFFQTLLDNAMQSLAKTCFPLTASLRNDSVYGTFWQTLESEANLTRDLICEAAGIKTLLENDPMIRSSITIRDSIVLPLLVIQQYALERLQNESTINPEEQEILEKLIVKSLAANINASRNSA